MLSCQCFLCRWGKRSAKSLSPTHTDTHASLYNGCFTLVPERERLRRGVHGEETKERHGGGVGILEKERNCYEVQGKGAEEKASEIKAVELR